MCFDLILVHTGMQMSQDVLYAFGGDIAGFSVQGDLFLRLNLTYQRQIMESVVQTESRVVFLDAGGKVLRFIPGIRAFPVRDIDVDMADTAGSSEKRNGFFEFFQVFDILDAGFFFYAFFGIKEAEPSLGFQDGL